MIRRAGIVAVVLAGLALGACAPLKKAPPSPAADVLAGKIAAAPRAEAPFEGWTEAIMEVGGQQLRLAVADGFTERWKGMRFISDPSPYDGILFVYEEDNATSLFTMANVPVALDIAWYASDGRPLGHTAMQPCSGESCPTYSSPVPFRYAIETLAGNLPGGPLS